MRVPDSIRPKLDALEEKPVNYDVDRLNLADPGPGWHVDDRWQPLPPETPGMPLDAGSWEVARRLIRGYEFADPSVVRAYYDSAEPYPGRNMLLELRALGLVSVHVGVRVNDVYNLERTVEDRAVQVFGWSYRTLEGHVERGQMEWEVWKWIDTGEVAFHVHAVSQPASIANPVIRIGFRLLRGHERGVFLNSTDRRMKQFTELALRDEGGSEGLRAASEELTARRLPDHDPAHDRLAENSRR